MVAPEHYVVEHSNSLTPPHPWRIPLESLIGVPSLKPSEYVEIPIMFHAADIGNESLKLMFVYREVGILFSI